MDNYKKNYDSDKCSDSEKYSDSSSDSEDSLNYSDDSEASEQSCNDYLFAWSNMIQLNKNITLFQNVLFENLPMSYNNNWTYLYDNSYIKSFVCPTNGLYKITYKIDVCPLSIAVTVITINNNEVNGSSSLIKAPNTEHIYTMSNSVIVYLHQDDFISLMFWSDNIGTKIGEPSLINGFLPNNIIPKETTATIDFIKIN